MFKNLTLKEKIEIATQLQIDKAVEDLQNQVEAGLITIEQSKATIIQYLNSSEFQQAVLGWVKTMNTIEA